MPKNVDPLLEKTFFKQRVHIFRHVMFFVMLCFLICFIEAQKSEFMLYAGKLSFLYRELNQ